jgi:methionyl-tRNA formyltransferase
MKKKIVILTGSELRHSFMRMSIALHPDLEVVRTYCEGMEGTLVEKIQSAEINTRRERHLNARAEVEKDFFSLFVNHVQDLSHPLSIPRKSINEPRVIDDIRTLNPDLVMAYGCSIISPELIAAFPKRFLNVHLGLSPYYRGSGTNFWPIVNKELSAIGATFMYIDPGIDTGEIIHQIRARVISGDSPHTIGNRLIRDAAFVYANLAATLDTCEHINPLPTPPIERLYKNSDFTEESVTIAYRNLTEGLIDEHIREHERNNAMFPIIEQAHLLTT